MRDGALASCSGDGTIRIWNPNTGELLRILEERAYGVNLVIELRNGSLAYRFDDRTIKIWNPNTEKSLSTLQRHTNEVVSIIELRNGNIISCSPGGMIKIWNIYPDDLSAQQIYLVLRLSKYAQHNEKIKLDAFWSEIYNSLPDYLKERYGRAIIS